jgi:hypothetical protein
MRRTPFLPLLFLALALAGCKSLSGAPSTIVTISNKITSLGAGQTYTFSYDVQHDQMMGVTTSLTGAGALVTGTGLYIAPPAPPAPNSITFTVTAANGSGVSDSDTFTIAPATGPVVSITPATFSVTAGGASQLLTIDVTEDSVGDTLTPGISGSPICPTGCGSFGAISGNPGGGHYTVDFIPPASVTQATVQNVQVLTTLQNAVIGNAYVTINP